MGKKNFAASTLSFEALESRQLLSVTIDTLAAADVQDDAAAFSSANIDDACTVDLKGWTAGDVDDAPVMGVGTGISLVATNNKINVIWDAVDGASKYTLQYQLDGAKTWVTRTITGTECTIYGVLGKDYNVRVKAYGASDDTYVSDSVHLLGQPILVRSELESDSVVFSIQNKTSLSGTGDMLTVSVKNLETGDVTNLYVRQGSSTTEENGISAAFEDTTLVVAGLDSHTLYQVWATNSNVLLGGSSSTSIKSNIVTFRTYYQNPDITGVEAVSDTSLKVTWQEATGVDLPNFYTVQYTKDGIHWLTSTTVARGTEHTIKGLKAGTEYDVRVFATGGKPSSLDDNDGLSSAFTKDSYRIYSLAVVAFSAPTSLGYQPNSAILAEISGTDASGELYDMGLIQSIALSCRVTGSVTLMNGKTASISSNVVKVINHGQSNVYYNNLLIGTLSLHGQAICFMPSENVAYATLGFTIGSPMTLSSNDATYRWSGRAFTTNKVYVEYTLPEEEEGGEE